MILSMVNSVVFDRLLLATGLLPGASTTSLMPLKASARTGAPDDEVSRRLRGGVKALGECSSSCSSMELCIALLELDEASTSSGHSLISGSGRSPRASLLNRLLKPRDTDKYCLCRSVILSE